MNDMQALFPIVLPTTKPDDKDTQKHNDEIRYHENNLNQNLTFIQNKITEIIAQINAMGGS